MEDRLQIKESAWTKCGDLARTRDDQQVDLNRGPHRNWSKVPGDVWGVLVQSPSNNDHHNRWNINPVVKISSLVSI